MTFLSCKNFRVGTRWAPESSLIILNISGLQEYLWLGGSDSSVEGNWQWLTGEPVPMGSPYWHTNQPDGGDVENKLVFSQYGNFADAHETDLYGYICQYTP